MVLVNDQGIHALKTAAQFAIDEHESGSQEGHQSQDDQSETKGGCKAVLDCLFTGFTCCIEPVASFNKIVVLMCACSAKDASEPASTH